MDFGELGGVATDSDDCELPGTLTREYSKSSGLGRILQVCAVTGGDATGVILIASCDVGCAGAFGRELASRSRSLFFSVAILHGGDQRVVR